MYDLSDPVDFNLMHIILGNPVFLNMHNKENNKEYFGIFSSSEKKKIIFKTCLFSTDFGKRKKIRDSCSLDLLFAKNKKQK